MKEQELLKLMNHWKRNWFLYLLAVIWVAGLWFDGHKDTAVLLAMIAYVGIKVSDREVLNLYYEYRGDHYRFTKGREVAISDITRLQNDILANAIKDTILDPLILERSTSITRILGEVKRSGYKELIAAIRSAEKDIKNCKLDKEEDLVIYKAPTEYEEREALKALTIIKNFIKNGYGKNEEYILLEPKRIIDYLLVIADVYYSEIGYDKVYKKINRFIHKLHIEKMTINDMGVSLEDLKNDIIAILKDQLENAKSKIDQYLIRPK